MCDCRKSIQEQLTEHFTSVAGEASNHKVELQGYGFAITENKMVERPYMPYKHTADYPLKKGGTKAKTKTGSMVFRFCPFCGGEFDK